MKNQHWIEEFEKLDRELPLPHGIHEPVPAVSELVSGETPPEGEKKPTARSLPEILDELALYIRLGEVGTVKALLEYARTQHGYELTQSDYERFEEILLRNSRPAILKLLLEHGPMPSANIIDYFHTFLLDRNEHAWSLFLPLIPKDELIQTLVDISVGKFVPDGDDDCKDAESNWELFSSLACKSLLYLEKQDLENISNQILSEQPNMTDFAVLLQGLIPGDK